MLTSLMVSIRNHARRWVILLIVSLVVAEIALRVVEQTNASARQVLQNPEQAANHRVPDPVLGVRGDPAFAEHDSAGFHNPKRPTAVDIVVLGDSQAYGRIGQPGEPVNARLGPRGPGPGSQAPRPVLSAVKAAWPLVLGRETSLRAYNMAFPGFGPPQYLALLDEEAAPHHRRAVFRQRLVGLVGLDAEASGDRRWRVAGAA